MDGYVYIYILTILKRVACYCCTVIWKYMSLSVYGNLHCMCHQVKQCDLPQLCNTLQRKQDEISALREKNSQLRDLVRQAEHLAHLLDVRCRLCVKYKYLLIQPYGVQYHTNLRPYIQGSKFDFFFKTAVFVLCVCVHATDYCAINRSSQATQCLLTIIIWFG